MAWPLTRLGMRQAFLTALANIAEGATVRSGAVSHHAVYAALADPEQRLCVFRGRDGMARALCSVYACFVTLFLGGCFRGHEQRRIPTQSFICGGMAVTPDGSRLLLTDQNNDCIRLYAVADGTHLGNVSLQFLHPGRIFVARDGYIFVADTGNNRVQVLTPHLVFSCVFGAFVLSSPTCVCASDDIVVANSSGKICAFARGDGALLWEFQGISSWGVSSLAVTLKHVVVQWFARQTPERVSIFSLEGTLLGAATTGGFETLGPIVCSASGEFAAAAESNRTLSLGTAAGLRETFVLPSVASYVAVHGDTVFVRLFRDDCVVVLT
jgi:hypothetical protein